MKRLKQKKVAGLLVIALLALTAVGAYAYFTTTGAGNGTGKVGSVTAWTVNGASETGDLFPLTYPNGAQALTGGSVVNDGDGYQNLNQIVATITGTDVGAACTASNFKFYSPLGTWTLSAGNTVATANLASGSNLPENLTPAGSHAFGDLSLTMIDTGSPQDGCQGAEVQITYDAS